MLAKRIIPCLDVRDGRVVKGVNFVHIRDAGDPVALARYYSDQGADEIVFLDITATSDARDTVADVVERTAEQVFVPLTVGGGIRTLEGFRRLLRAGADKISVNSAAVDDPTLIARAAERFGSQCVVLAIDARSRGDGTYEVVVHGGRQAHGTGRRGVGPPGAGTGRRGDPAHLHGRRRDQGGLRPGHDGGGHPRGGDPGHRLRRLREPALSPRSSRRPAATRAGGLPVPLRALTVPR